MTFFHMAAAMAVLTFLVHVFAGGKAVARPLLADENLPRASKWLNYYCWHITSVMIAFIAAGFIWLAVSMPQTPMAVLLSSLTGAVSLLSAGVGLKAGIHPFRFPSTSLFAATSALGWAGLLT